VASSPKANDRNPNGVAAPTVVIDEPVPLTSVGPGRVTGQRQDVG
jgi:hypothetical protein